MLNRQAVDFAIAASLALGCEVQHTSVFARKNYFYPDLPKGYQISQFEQPLALRGAVDVTVGGTTTRIGITRVHMEEDAGKSVHAGGSESGKSSGIDLNRSGVPLIEIVSEPDIRSAAEAAEYFSRVHAILTWIGVNDGNMEEGSLRCDANVSIRPVGQQAFGTRSEVKNVNSFRYLEKAIEYEIERQTAVVTSGGRVVQETRLWDAAAGRTFSMRSKEEAHDYRYFPEPDLPPLVCDESRIAALRASMPELPDARRQRFVREYGLPEYDAGVLTQSAGMAAYYEQVNRAFPSPKANSNLVMGPLQQVLNERGIGLDDASVPPATALAALTALVDKGTISHSMAKDVLVKMFDTGREAPAIVEADGLAQIGDEDAVVAIIRGVMADNADAVAQYRAGKTSTFGFLVGQVMKGSKGKANPRLANTLLKRELDGQSPQV